MISITKQFHAVMAAVVMIFSGLFASSSISSEADAAVVRSASPLSCVTYGRNLIPFALTGDPYNAVRAALAAGGCGSWIADTICWGSRQWFGGPFRDIVRIATRGRYDRC